MASLSRTMSWVLALAYLGAILAAGILWSWIAALVIAIVAPQFAQPTRRPSGGEHMLRNPDRADRDSWKKVD